MPGWNYWDEGRRLPMDRAIVDIKSVICDIVMQSINLYIFNENSRAAMYGIGTYLKELTASFVNTKICVTVVYLRDESGVKMEEIDGIRHWYIPAPIEKVPYMDHDSYTKQYYCNIVYFLRLHIADTDSLIFHMNYTQNRSLAEALKDAFNCKLVFATHYLTWCFDLSGNVTRFRQILAAQETDQVDEFKKSIIESYRKEKELFETVDRIICLSENTRLILQDDYQIKPDKTTAIYNGLTDIYSDTDKQTLRQKYHIPDIPVILFVGRLDDTKGLTFALRAFKTVLNERQCHLMIAGNGSFDKYMKECEDIWMYVTWTGLINKAKLYDLYSIADIGILPSFTEQCSYVAIEMMMHSLPIITTAAPGLKEMTEDGINSLQVPIIEHPDRVEIDTDFLAEKMLYLLQNPEEAKRIGMNARKRYEERYSGGVFRKNMLDFYQSLYLS
jgi:glycosyltransferase